MINLMYTCTCGSVATTMVGDVAMCDECASNYVACYECGEMLRVSNLYTVHLSDGEDALVCVDCLDNYNLCSDCDEYYEEALTPVGGGRGFVCSDCAEHYVECAGCGELIHEENLYFVESEDRDYCGRCYDRYIVHCDVCGDAYHCDSEYILSYYDGGYICRSCFDNNESLALCNNCGGVYSRDSTGENTCENCTPHHHHGHSHAPVIRDYHDRPPLKFYYEECEEVITPRRYFGFELEVDNDSYNGDPNDIARVALETLNSGDETWWAMRDGSLSRKGFELTSHPMTVGYIEKNVFDRLKEASEYLIGSRYRSHDNSTCGLHFHVSRNSASVGTFAKMAYSMDKFWDVAATLSRRKDFHWCERWEAIGKSYEELKAHVDNRDGSRRYLALNFTNTSTVELRLFKGTLNVKSFIAAFHFYKFLIEWCASNQYDFIREVDKRTFLEDMSLFSPELKGYMKYRGLWVPED